jgi:hypothetical protein
MEKAVWYSTGVFAILSWVAAGYALFNPQVFNSIYTLFYLLSMSMFLTVLFLLQDPDANPKAKSTGFGLLTTIAVMLVVLLIFSSCSTGRQGYGCKGKESWKRMVERINKPY